MQKKKFLVEVDHSVWVKNFEHQRLVMKDPSHSTLAVPQPGKDAPITGGLGAGVGCNTPPHPNPHLSFIVPWRKLFLEPCPLQYYLPVNRP